MSHKSVRLLLEDVAKSLSDKVQFGYGRRSEFNMIAQPRYPYIWLLPLTAGRRFTNDDGTRTKTWNVAIVFLYEDEADSDAKHTENILDISDEIVDRYLQRLDDWFYRSDDNVGTITIRNDNQQPFYKDDAGIHSGWLVTFQATVSDDFLYCTPENIDLYAGNI